MKKTIPIVFSTDDAYALFCYLAVYSTIKNADRSYQYDIRILYESLKRENIEFLNSLSNEYAKVKCINIEDVLRNVDLRGIIHLSVATYYRLFIPEIMNEYDKVLYLDSDIIVNADVSKLYEHDTMGHPVAAVKDIKCSYIYDHMKDLGIEDFSMMFNAGILLIDTAVFRENRIKEKCLQALEEDYGRKVRKYIYADQDLLNSTLKGDFQALEPNWNFQWQYMWRLDSLFDDYRDIYDSVSKKPYIVHYAGDRKPWTYPELPFADLFWSTAEEAGILLKIISNVLEAERKKKEELGCFAGFRLPYEQLKAGCNVAVYGAGMVGKDFCDQLRRTLFAKVAIWVDRSYDEKPEEWGVESPDDLIKTADSYDYIIIAIDDKKIAQKIRDWMTGNGIPEEKIAWQKYRRSDYGDLL